MRFVFRLAGHLGMTVQQLRQSMTSDELVGWMAFSQLEPFGSEVDWWQAGTVASAAMNAWGAKTKASDFVPDWDPKPSDPASVQAYFLRLASGK